MFSFVYPLVYLTSVSYISYFVTCVKAFYIQVACFFFFHKAALEKAKSSLTTWRTLSQWMNLGRLSTSMGKSHSQTMANQVLHAARNTEAVAFLDFLTTGMVVLDCLKASEQVRVVLNNRKQVSINSYHHCFLSHFHFALVCHNPRGCLSNEDRAF